MFNRNIIRKSYRNGYKLCKAIGNSLVNTSIGYSIISQKNTKSKNINSDVCGTPISVLLAQHKIYSM